MTDLRYATGHTVSHRVLRHCFKRVLSVCVRMQMYPIYPHFRKMLEKYAQRRRCRASFSSLLAWMARCPPFWFQSCVISTWMVELHGWFVMINKYLHCVCNNCPNNGPKVQVMPTELLGYNWDDKYVNQSTVCPLSVTPLAHCLGMA
jgi:hypothetical protein